MPFQSECALVAPGLLQGRVVLDAQPDRVWHVGLFINGVLQGAVTADLPIFTGEGRGDASGDHGFSVHLNRSALKGTDQLCLKVLNTRHVIVEDTLQALDKSVVVPTDRSGSVWVVQGLTLAGVLDDTVTDLPSYDVIALEGERIVGRSRILRWQHIGDPQDPMGRAVAFDLLLDPELADGQVHLVHVETSTGQMLPGSPLQVVAWPGHLRAAMVQRATSCTPAQARRLDMMQERMLGQSQPLSAYEALYPALGPAGSTWVEDGRIGPDGRWFNLGQSDWVLFCHNDLQPLADFAARFAAELPQFATAKAVFCDLAIRQADGVIWPLLLPAFDWERLQEQGYASLCFALPKAALQLGADSLTELLFNWLSRDAGAPDRVPDRAGIWHLPHPGALGEAAALIASCPDRSDALVTALQGPGRLPAGTTLSRLTQPGALFPALHLGRPVADHAVSVIVPTRNQGALLHAAITGLIAQNPGFDLDILIVDNGTDTPESLEILNHLEDQGARILEFAEGFNFSLINNLASEHARHAQLCFMNNDVAFPIPGVLQELCSRMACPGVGAAGPLMVRASDIIQHGGVVLGPWTGAVHAFEDRMAGDPGYGELLCVASEPGALTGAMLLTRRALFEELGGFDCARFAVNFNDVDYCLRLRAAGYRVVFSPHTRIRHYESVSRGRETATPAGVRMQRELACLRQIWGDALRNDPQYHPLFALDGLPYRQLGLDHRAPGARSAILPSALVMPDWV